MANNDDNLNIRIGADPTDIEVGSKAAAAAIKKVTQEAGDLDRAFKKLRSSLDPMYAAQTQYNNTLVQLDMLMSKGVLGQKEYASSIEKAREALARQTSEQLKGTAVANEAATAMTRASQARNRAEDTAAKSTSANIRRLTLEREAEQARITVNEARQVKARSSLALQEAKDSLAAAEASKLTLPARPRNAQGQFIPRATLEADRAAAVEEAAIQLKIAQVEDTVAGQRVRNTQRVSTTRQEAANRAASAERTAAEVAKAAAAEVTAADIQASEAATLLSAAQVSAAEASLAAAAQQAQADEVLAQATAVKARTAAEAAIAEEKVALATAKAARADAEASVQARKLEKAQGDAARAEQQRAASAERLKSSLDRTYAAQVKYNQAVEMANGLAASGHIDETTRLNAISAAEQGLSQALKTNTGHTINNRAAYESLILVHEALAHRWTRMSSSAMILGQALAGADATGAAMSVVFSGMGAVIAGVVVALGALAYAAYEGSIEQVKLQRALSMTGHYAGMTADQVEEAGKRIGEKTHTSASAATASLTELAASGRVTGQTMTTMGEIIATVSDQSSEKAAEITKELIKMADDPLPSMRRLQDQFHFLIPEEEDHIRQLVDMGDKTNAVIEISDKFNAAIQSEKVELNGLGQFAHNAAVAMGDLWQAMKDIGKAATPTKRLADIRQLLAQENTYHPGQDTAYKAKLQKEELDIQRKMAADADQGRKSAQIKQVDDLEKNFDELEKVTRTAHEKAKREKDKWKLEAHELLDNPLTDENHRKEMKYRLAHPEIEDARIDKKFDAGDIPKKGHKPKGPSEVSLMQEDLNRQLNLQKNYFADADQFELDYWTKKLSTAKAGSLTYVAIDAKIAGLRKKIAKSDYSDDIAALKNKIDEAKGDLAAEEAAWDKYLAKVRFVMHEESKEFQEAAKAYRDAQRKIADERTKMMEKKEKDSEKPVDRASEEKKTGQDLKGGALDYGHEQGIISDRKYAEAKRALVVEQIQNEQQLEEAINQKRVASFQDQLRTENLSKDSIKNINEQIEQQEQIHQDKMDQIRSKGLIAYQKANQQASSATNATWTKVYDAMASHLQQSLNAGIQHGFNFTAAMRGMALTVLTTWTDMASKMLTNWIKTLIFKDTVTRASTGLDVASHAGAEAAKTVSTVVGTQARVGAVVAGAAEERGINFITAIKAIGANAAKAASGAYAALAGIPIIGPVLGAAAAAGTFAAVLAFGAFASAKGGQVQVPYDGQMTELHKDEMVLPAWAANPLRANLRASGSNQVFNTASAAGSAAREHSISNTFNFQPQHSHQNADLEQLLRTQGKSFRKWINNEHRNGTILNRRN